MFGFQNNEVAEADGSNTNGIPPPGPLTRKKVSPEDVSTVRVSDCTGQSSDLSS
jgi:hypothetical protein